MTDGVGAQLQRIYGIYAISRLLRASYLHTPIERVDYQGLPALERNTADPGFHDEFNRVFHIESDVSQAQGNRDLRFYEITTDELNYIVGDLENYPVGDRQTVVRIALPYGISDKYPDCYEACREISPFASPVRDDLPLRVAIHVRRGELFARDSHRLLPNAYYIDVARAVADLLERSGIDYRLELHTEVPTKEFVVRRGHHGFHDHVGAPAIFGPEMCRLEQFDALPNLVHCINETTMECLRKLATADVLIMSRSSFSYLAGILNRNGVMLYHPFWHAALSSWLTVDPDRQFDPALFMAAIDQRRERQRTNLLN